MPNLRTLRTKFIHAAKSKVNFSSDDIKEFIFSHTYLNQRPFSTKHHEYQDKIIEILSDPDVDFVLSKVAQAGASEVIYRVKLSYAYLTPSYYSALILPSLGQVTEVMKVRIAQIIAEAPMLAQAIDPKIDSASLKRLRNGSVLYALSGSKDSKSTAITRPIRDITVDELARVSMKTVTAMSNRQRHQEHKSTTFFSTPLYEGFDISAELDNCGVVWENILSCSRCSHEFFPDFYKDVRIPGYTHPVRTLTVRKIAKSNLNIQEAYLECPRCNRQTLFGYPYTRWVNTAETPNLPKIGMKIGPFDLPKFVSPGDLIKAMVTNQDRNDFEQQALGIPTSSKNSALDISQLRFESQPPGPVNVFGLDVGKYLWMTIGTVMDARLYIHTIAPIKLKDVRQEFPKIINKFRCIGGVMDLMPETSLARELVMATPGMWAAEYRVYQKPRPELFTLDVRDDEATGKVKLVSINMSPAFDVFSDMVSSGLLTYRTSEYDQMLLEHLQVMRRVRDAKNSSAGQTVYKWIKPKKLSIRGASDEDHLHHSSVYCMVASRIVMKDIAQVYMPVDIHTVDTRFVRQPEKP